MDHGTPYGQHPDPCYGHGGPQCSPPYPFACPDCGRAASPPAPRRSLAPLLRPLTLSEVLDGEAARITHEIKRHFFP